MSNITQVLNTDKNLKTLKKTVHASDLDQLLSSTGPFTFFTPTDVAFEKLGAGVVEGLLEPKNKADLITLMNNHLVKGKISFDALKSGEALTTLGGRALMIEESNGQVRIDGAVVLAREQKLSNGVIHSIDKVFMHKD